MYPKIHSESLPSEVGTDPLIALLSRQRKALGLRQQDVADRAGISRRALVSIEAGKDCTVSTLRCLCIALGLELEARPLRAWVPEAKSFRTAEEMSDYQSDRELAEALKVQSMPPAAYTAWLLSNWAPLQDQANELYAGIPRAPAANAWHFKTIEEKNRFDQDRETAFAVEVSKRQA